MANPCLLHLPLRSGLDGRDRNGVVSATASGPVRFTADGYYAEEGTTNLIANPVVQNDTGSFAPIRVDATRDTTTLIDGYYSLRCEVNDVSLTNAGVHTSPSISGASAGVPYTISVDVLHGGASARDFYVSAAWYDAGGSVISQSTSSMVSVPPNVPTTISATFTSPALTARISPQFRANNTVIGDVFWMTKFQAEQKAYATSFCHGSLGTGYSWAGTAHASASTRAASSLSFDELNRINSSIGAVVFRFRRAIDTGGVWYLFYVGGSTGKDLLASRVAADDKPTITTSEAGAGAGARATWGVANVVNQSSVYYADWTSTIASLSIDNGSLVTGARGGAPLGDLVSDFYLGSTSTPNAHSNAAFSDLMIFDRPLTDAERATLAATPEWSFDALQPKFGGMMRLGTGIGLSIGSVAAPAAIAIARTLGEL